MNEAIEAVDTIETPPRKTNKGRTLRAVPTPRQRAVARIAADVAMGKAPDIKSNGQIIAAAGYGTGLQTQPSRVLDSVGVHIALEDMGFSEETAKNVVKSILSNEKAMHKDRLKAADMVFKVHGTYAAEKTIALNVDVQSDDTRLLELAERLRSAAK